jgi:molybdopterin-binding protein
MLRVEGITKAYRGFSLNDVTFTVNEGDYFMLLGPSGAGKSLILEIIAGLIGPDSGRVVLDDADITRVGMSGRRVGLVFQDLAVFPHMSVFSNVAYALRRKGIGGEMLRRRVNALLDKVAIPHLGSRNPETLSGGELQRVALARTLALEPRLLLLDEPLASIDVQLRAELRALLRGLNREGQTIIHVTHDYEEAISLGSRVAVVNNGSIAQIGNTLEVFQHPASEFVASFSGIKNFYPATIVESTEFDLRRARIDNANSVWLYADQKEGEGFVCFPENTVTLSVEEPMQSAVNHFKGVIVDIFPQKFGYEVVVDAGIRISALVTRESVERLSLKNGSAVWASCKASTVRFVPRV